MPSAGGRGGELGERAALDRWVEQHLAFALSRERTVEAASGPLARLPRVRRETLKARIRTLAHASHHLGYALASSAEAAARLGDDQLDDWVREVLGVFDARGLRPALDLLARPDTVAERQREERHAVHFDEVAPALGALVCGLSGRPLALDVGDPPHTDTETLFLPERIARFPSRAQNRDLYKALALSLWAQTWFGTWRVPRRGAHVWSGALHELVGGEAGAPVDGARVVEAFQRLELLRLDACLARELPGARRHLLKVAEATGEPLVPPGWEDWRLRLARADATVEDSYALLPHAYARARPGPLSVAGSMRPEVVEGVRARRRAREDEALMAALAHPPRAAETGSEAPAPNAPAMLLQVDARQAVPLRIELGGRAVVVPAEARRLLLSAWQDYGEEPPAELLHAGDAPYPAAEAGRAGDGDAGATAEAQAFLYDEWDCTRQGYRKGWCTLREAGVGEGDLNFARAALERHRVHVRQLRRTFEALRGEDRWLRRQIDGEQVDLDALVDAHADWAAGLIADERVYARRRKVERDIDVLFLVDVSGSTKGWVNDAEREALLLLCEALEALGDRYAIYGFSGMTRQRCECYRVKGFDDPYDDTARARISGLAPQDYTRMGVAIRHVSRILGERQARTRLLVVLTDGKPDDFDGYRGRYGMEDTRQALQEAMHAGIHAFCITLDREAPEYLPHLFGHAHYVVIDDVRRLPARATDIYRRITA